MHDHTGKQVATGMSPPIMITDDHKSNKIKSGRKRLRTDVEKPSSSISSPFDLRHQSSAGPLAPQRQSNNFFQPNQYQIQPRPPATTSQPSSVVMDTRSSPITPMDSPLAATSTSPFMTEKAVSTTHSTISGERPLLQRLIPNEGPTFGGVEVTLLGSGFRSGLTCMFGDVAASSTHYWSPNTLVCILPPATEAGTVVVSFKEYPLVVDSQDVTLFTYYNENDRALMELALQVVGLKMTGKVEDARDIAMRIVQGGSASTDSKGQQSTNSNGNGQGQQHRQQMSLERHIIQVLEVMSTFRDVDSSDVSITSAQGHTMLHLAAMLGFSQLTRALIDLGCDVDVTDKNGYTALHYSAWYSHENVVNVLLDHGSADPEISNMWNKKPLHLTESTSIRNALWNHEPLIYEEDFSDSIDGYTSSDMVSADVDTSYAEDDTDVEDDGSIWHSDAESVNEHTSNWRNSYLSNSEESTSSADETPVMYEGLHHRRRQQLVQQHPQTTSLPLPQQSLNIASIKYLNEEESTSHSADEIMDAEPLYDIEHSTDYEDNDDEPKEMTWMQRTLSHFQQPTTDNNSFLQNIKNNIPAKPAELNLKNIADHLLQFPRPAAMIANVFSTEGETNTSAKEEPAEQTLAWYMALAYAMGARSLNEEEEHRFEEKNEYRSTIQQTSRVQAIEANKRRDKRLFSFWVPMLCRKLYISLSFVHVLNFSL